MYRFDTDLRKGLVSLSMTYDGNPLSSFSIADNTPLRKCGLILSTGFVFGRLTSVANSRLAATHTASRKLTVKQLPIAFIFYRVSLQIVTKSSYVVRKNKKTLLLEDELAFQHRIDKFSGYNLRQERATLKLINIIVITKRYCYQSR